MSLNFFLYTKINRSVNAVYVSSTQDETALKNLEPVTFDRLGTFEGFLLLVVGTAVEELVVLLNILFFEFLSRDNIIDLFRKGDEMWKS